MSAYDLAAEVDLIADRVMSGCVFTLHADGTCIIEAEVPEHLPRRLGYMVTYPPGWLPSRWLTPHLQPPNAWLSELVLRRLVQWDHGGRYMITWVYDADDWNTTLGWCLLAEVTS